MSGTTIKRYVILTPFDKPEVVAGILALHHIDAAVVMTGSGALVVRELPVPQYDEWDIRNITGPDEVDEDDESLAPSDNAPVVAATLSQLSRYGVVLIDVNLGSDVGIEAGISGLVRARRFLSGRAGEEISSGLLLNTVDPLIEKIVLGQEDPSEHDAILTGDVTTSMITQLARGRKTRGKGRGISGSMGASDAEGSRASRDAAPEGSSDSSEDPAASPSDLARRRGSRSEDVPEDPR